MRNFFGLSGSQIVFQYSCLTSTSITNKHNWFESINMFLHEISQSSGMKSSNIDFSERLIFLVNVRLNNRVPLLPRSLRGVTEVIKSISLFREFDFCN